MRGALAFGTALTALFFTFIASYATLSIMGREVPVAAVMGGISAENQENAEKKDALMVEAIGLLPGQNQKDVYRNTIDADSAALDEKLQALAGKHNVVGMSVAAFEHNRIVYRHTYGLQNREENIPVTDATKYRAASISKMVTAALAMMLEDETGFSIDDDLRGVIPSMQNPYFPDEPVTTRQLMMHTSGLTDGSAYKDAVSELRFPPLSSLLSAPGMWMSHKPGTSYEYSNFGSGIVSGVIEAQTGMRFYDYAKKALFDPLGIDAGYSMHLVRNPRLVANIYNQSRELMAEPGRWTNMDSVYAPIPIGEMYLLGHGDLFISAEDLALIGIILAGDGTHGGRRYISQEALRQMNTTAFIDREAGVARGLGTFAITDALKDGTVYGHQGNAYGMISGMFYDPATKTGVVFLSNGCSLTKGGQGLYDVNRDIMSEVWRYLVPSD